MDDQQPSQSIVQYHALTRWVSVLSVIAVILASVLLGLMQTTPPAKYYATTMSGEVIPMHALSEPVVTDDYLIRWAGIALRKAFNIDFVNAGQQIEGAQSDFTSDGWQQFLAAVKSSGLREDIVAKKLQVSAVAVGDAVIVSRLVVAGRYTWRVQIPMLLTFESASDQRQARYLVTLDIERISTLDAFKGIQINRLSLESRS